MGSLQHFFGGMNLPYVPYAAFQQTQVHLDPDQPEYPSTGMLGDFLKSSRADNARLTPLIKATSKHHDTLLGRNLVT
jgi:hypothetical protein